MPCYISGLSHNVFSFWTEATPKSKQRNLVFCILHLQWNKHKKWTKDRKQWLQLSRSLLLKHFSCYRGCKLERATVKSACILSRPLFQPQRPPHSGSYGYQKSKTEIMKKWTPFSFVYSKLVFDDKSKVKWFSYNKLFVSALLLNSEIFKAKSRPQF